MNYALDKEIDHKLGSVQDRDDLHAAFAGGGEYTSSTPPGAGVELATLKVQLDVSIHARGGAVCVGCVCVCVSW